jgi:hypothetical protein
MKLSDRVAELAGPCREIDAGIWLRAIEKPQPGEKRDKDIIGRWPHYTASIDAAASLVPPNHTWSLTSCGEHDMPQACVTSMDDRCEDFVAHAVDPALALCAAGLKARGL